VKLTRVLGFCTLGSWRWGCAEKVVGLRYSLVKLAMLLCKQDTKKTLKLFYTRGYLILPMTEIVFKKHVGVLYLLVKIHKNPQR
jgi:hypothetical protein